MLGQSVPHLCCMQNHGAPESCRHWHSWLPGIRISSASKGGVLRPTVNCLYVRSTPLVSGQRAPCSAFVSPHSFDPVRVRYIKRSYRGNPGWYALVDYSRTKPV
jgi:hypothetical protein